MIRSQNRYASSVPFLSSLADPYLLTQALQVRRSLLDQAKTAYTPSLIPGSQFSTDEMALMDKVLDEKMQQRR
jgi:hypothetical protein